MKHKSHAASLLILYQTHKINTFKTQTLDFGAVECV
jgi:hypothetical protein